MIWQDRVRTDPTKRKFIDENGNEQNVNIEEIQSNITQSGTPVNATTMNNIEKNLGTYGNDTYDSTATYQEGNVVTHNALLYRAKQDIETPEEWTEAHWEETSALAELSNTSGNEVVIGDEEDVTRQTKILVDTTDEFEIINQEVCIGATNPNNERTWFKKSNNLFNKKDIQEGKRLGQDGALLTSTEGVFTSNKIYLKPLITYHINFETVDYKTRVCFYKEDGTFISYVQDDTFTVPNLTNYVFFCANDTELNTIQLNEGSSALPYEPYVEYKSIQVDNKPFTEAVSVGTDENNSRVWFKKSMNLFNNLVVSNTSNGASGTILSTGIRAKVTTAGANKYVGYKLPNPEKLLGKKLTISATITKSSTNDGLIRFYWGNNDTITTNINSTITATGSQTFTMPSAFPSGSNQILIVFSATASNTGAVDDYVDYTNVMLEYGETATPYTQYGLNSINVDNEEIYSTPVILFNSSTTDNSITLSDNINNYKYYEIVFHRGNGYSSVKMPTTQLTNISLMTGQFASDLYRLYNANISISGTTLTKNYARYVNFTTNSCSSADDISNFYIDKVIGYK